MEAILTALRWGLYTWSYLGGTSYGGKYRIKLHRIPTEREAHPFSARQGFVLRRTRQSHQRNGKNQGSLSTIRE